MNFFYCTLFVALARHAFALPPLDSTSLTRRATTPIPTVNSTLQPIHFIWKAPAHDDDRAPCPMLNTLANHGFLPHNGRHITREIFSKGVSAALRLQPESIDRLFTGGLGASPVENATYFDLGIFHVRNFIEHDGSTSMQDIIVDHRDVYHEPTFNNFMSHCPKNATDLTIPLAASAKARHMRDMSLINPRFSVVASQRLPIMLEMASVFVVFGHSAQQQVKRSLSEYFFRNQRLPVELGWSPSNEEIDFTAGIRRIANELVQATPKDIPFLCNPGRPAP